MVYSETPLTDLALRKATKYCFNTESDVVVGDKLKSPSYSTSMIVTDVLDTSFKYYNRSTGSLTNEIKSTLDYSIKTLVLKEDNPDVVFAFKA